MTSEIKSAFRTRWVHAATGCLFVIVFLLTGVYMKMNFPDLYQGREEIRMMYRATHIYILLSALINLALAFAVTELDGIKRTIQRFLSGLIATSPVLLTLAFFIEPPGYRLDRPVSLFGIIFLFVGIILTFSLQGFCRSKRAKRQ